MYITWQTIITAGAVLGALAAIISLYNKIIRWIDRQSGQDKAIEELRHTHATDVAGLQKEQTLIVYGLWSCLKGLQEQGCNGPVTKGIEMLEKHLNLKAHDQIE